MKTACPPGPTQSACRFLKLQAARETQAEDSGLLTSGSSQCSQHHVSGPSAEVCGVRVGTARDQNPIT